MSGSEIDRTVVDEAISWTAKKAWPGHRPGWVKMAGYNYNKRTLKATPLDSEASGRKYYRVEMASDTYILQIGPDLVENKIWLDYWEKLYVGGIPLPKLIKAEELKGFFLIEDLGEKRLDKLVEENEADQRLNLYAEIMEILAQWHNKALDLVKKSIVFKRNPQYDLPFVREYEWKYFLNGLITMELENEMDLAALEKESELFLNLPECPQVLIHRDFQSRNLISYEDQFYVLDWQGARLGPAAYDLASLLYDPYVDLTDKERQDYLNIYLKHRDEPNLEKSLAQIAPLRLMQAIGAYTHLAKKGLPYGKYIKPALTRLEKILPKGSKCPKLLKALIKKAIIKAAELYPKTDEGRLEDDLT
ncbi:MAG: phosphotransferase [Deltaproteobacteria bacterium]|jgi:aminoglycoside/choline kinase family phosphotransferase|nr:phosphotransferase [Deltaproteobacteria bacterium]